MESGDMQPYTGEDEFLGAEFYNPRPKIAWDSEMHLLQ